MLEHAYGYDDVAIVPGEFTINPELAETTFKIQELVSYYSTLQYSTFGQTGTNKNMVGFLFVVSAASIFNFLFIWEPKRFHSFAKLMLTG